MISAGVVWRVQQEAPTEPTINLSETPAGPVTFVQLAAEESKGEKREPLSAVYVIKLGDDEAINVQLRQGQGKAPVQIESLAEEYEDLARRAENGDAETALVLSRAMGECKTHGYRSEDDFREAIAKLSSEYVLPLASGGGVIQISPDDQTNAVDIQYWTGVVTKTYEECRRIPEDAAARQHEFLELAASNGSLVAIKELARVTSDKAVRLELYQSAWKAGDYNAALWVGHGYEEGWNGEPDPVLGFAYTLLGLELTRLAMTDRNGFVSPRYERIALATDIPGRALALSHDEHARAIGIAKEILASNNNCCLGLWRAESMAR